MNSLSSITKNQDIFLTESFCDKNIGIDVEHKLLENHDFKTLKVCEKVDKSTDENTQIEEKIITKKELNAQFQKSEKNTFFEKLLTEAADSLNSINPEDFYGNFVEKFIDFTQNISLHNCESHFDVSIEDKKPKIFRKHIKSLKIKENNKLKKTVFMLEPSIIIFENYEVHTRYKKKFELRNITLNSSFFTYSPLSKNSFFHIETLTNLKKLAPGMCAKFLITFIPKVYKNDCETISFASPDGLPAVLKIISCRKPPKLQCFIYNFLRPKIEVQKSPKSEFFSQKRCKALNFTIDCGCCLLGDFKFMGIEMKNLGPKGEFLITTETEWCFNEKNDYSRKNLCIGNFLLFPVYFGIGSGGTSQLFVMFSPESEGVFTEKIVIICDNNTYVELALLGDCVMFSNNMIKVNMYLRQNTFIYSNKQISICLEPYKWSTFTLSIINKSSIDFEYFWKIRVFHTTLIDKKEMTADWITISHGCDFLTNYSVTDVVVRLTAKTEENGCYYSFISLYLRNIPVIGIPHSYEFVVKDENGQCIDQESIVENKNNLNDKKKLVDVHMFDLEIICRVEKPIFKKNKRKKATRKIAEKKFSKNFILSKKVLNFGVLLKGLQVKKHLTIENVSKKIIFWKVAELRLDGGRFLFESSNKHLSQSNGILQPFKKQKITYSVETKENRRWVSFLLFFTNIDCCVINLNLNSVCLIVYEVADIHVTIHTNTNIPLLMFPKELLTIGVPISQNVFIQNTGSVTGCFYFFKPIGNSAEKIKFCFLPASGCLPAGTSKQINIEITILEIRNFKSILIPCFTGDLNKMVFLKFGCIIQTMSVRFILQSFDGGYTEVLWPMKENNVLYQIAGEDELLDSQKMHKQLEKLSKLSLISENAVAKSYPTVKTGTIKTNKSKPNRL